MTPFDQNLVSGIAAFEGKHFNTAYPLLKPLADVGNAEAQYRVAIMYQNGLGMVPNGKRAFEYMHKAAKQDHPMAQHGLGFMYLFGECAPKSGQDAETWFLKAIEHGLVGSMTTLARMYKEGDGIPQDDAKARALFVQAGFDPDEVA